MSGGLWISLVSYVLMGLLALGMLVGGLIVGGGAAPLVAGVVLSMVWLPCAWVLGAVALRPVVIADGTVRIPGVFSTRIVPLSAITGVGLVYRAGRQTAGWTPMVWHGADQQVILVRWLVTTWRLRPGQRSSAWSSRTPDWSLPLPNEDSDYLSSTRAGRAATQIYRAALAWQGHHGPLMHQARQTAIAYNPNLSAPMLAWWSPDGTMGRAAGLPPPRTHSGAQPAPVGARRRGGPALLVGICGALGTFIAGVILANIDGAAGNGPRTSVQNTLIGSAAILMFLGPILAIATAIWMWRRRPAEPSADLTATEIHRPRPAPAPISAAQPAATRIPVASPAVRQGRRRCALLGLCSAPFTVALGVLTALMLNRPGRRGNGEICQSVLGPASRHPSSICNTWRHDQIVHFSVVAAILVSCLIVVTGLEVRAFRRLKQAIRVAAS